MKVFIDSSVLVEYIKGNQTDLLEQLMSSENELFVNAVVYSEFMFYYLAVIGEKSPLAIKESKLVKSVIEKHNPIELFENFQLLPIDNEIVNLSYKFMQEYNFLPNDALILATAKLNDITYLASFDENDFKISCKKEKIKLVKVLTDIK
jgi:predicted nucleic acid-binding protein